MTSRKVKHARAMEKRKEFLEEVKQSGLEAQKADKKRRNDEYARKREEAYQLQQEIRKGSKVPAQPGRRGKATKEDVDDEMQRAKEFVDALMYLGIDL